MSILSLAQLTLPGSDPVELIEAAAIAGFSHVGIRLVPPMKTDAMRPVMTDKTLQAGIRRRLRETGVKVLDIEVFWLLPDFDASEIEPAFAFGAELGARYAVTVGNDPDHNRQMDNFHALCRIAASYGIQPGLEFIPYCQIASLAAARAMLLQAKEPKAGLLVDALHLSRSGESTADLEAVPPGQILYAHLCDAPLAIPETVPEKRREAREARLYPGEGELPLAAFMAALPPDTPIGVEAPNERTSALSFAERAGLVYRAAKPFVPG
jgi:sugar phosphate isomerase/epimerase